jgi:hypothetical protein
MPTSWKKKGPGRIEDAGANSMHPVNDHLNGEPVFDGAEQVFDDAATGLGSQQ